MLAVRTVLTWRQVAFWHDDVRLFEHAISVEDSDYIRGVLAATLIAEHRYWEAERHLSIGQLSTARPHNIEKQRAALVLTVKVSGKRLGRALSCGSRI